MGGPILGAGAAQQPRQGLRRGGLPRVGVLLHRIEAGGAAPHEQRGPRTLALGMPGVGLRKDHTLAGHTLKMGHPDPGCRTAGIARDHGHRSAAPRLVIGQNENEIGGRSPSGSPEDSGQERNEYGSDHHGDDEDGRFVLRATLGSRRYRWATSAFLKPDAVTPGTAARTNSTSASRGPILRRKCPDPSRISPE